LRWVNDSKLPIDHVPSHPDDAVVGIDDDGHLVAFCAGHLTVYQQILQFSVPGGGRHEPIACSTVSNRQSAGHPFFRHDGHRTVGGRRIPCRKGNLGRHHTIDLGNRHLAGDGQRVTECRNRIGGNDRAATG
jgi:hypothetical protein